MSSSRSSRDRYSSSYRGEGSRSRGGRSNREERHSAENPEPDADGVDGGLFLGFEHRMNTDERRRMRERERKEGREVEPGNSNVMSSPSTVPRTSSYTSGMRPTSSSTYARYSSRASDRSRSASHESKSSSSRRSTAYSRELEKRERARDRVSSRRDRPSVASDATESSGRSGLATRSEHSPKPSSRVSSSSDVLRSSSQHHQRRSVSPELVSRRESDRPRVERSPRSPRPSRRERSDRSPRRGKSRDASPSRRHRSGSPNHHIVSTSSRARDEDRERRREERRRLRREQERTEDDSVDMKSHRSGRHHHSSRDRAERSDDDTTSRRSARRGHRESERERRRHRSRSQEPDLEEEAASTEKLVLSTGDLSSRETKASRTGLFDKKVLAAGTDTPSYVRRGKLSSGDGDAYVPSSTQTAARDRLRARMLGEGTSSSMTEPSPRVGRSKLSESAIAQPSPFAARSGLLASAAEEKEIQTKLEPDGVLGDSTGPSSESESETDVSQDLEEEEEAETSSDENEESWSVRVCLIKAVELQSSLVANVPLCPVLKFGLVKIPEEEANNSVVESTGEAKEASEKPKSSVAEKMEASGLTSFPRARVRCTSTKILSNRDKGEMEFHEEMRWDKVRRPIRTALAVELCARAALPPPNYFESPLIVKKNDTETIVGESVYGSASALPSSLGGDKWSGVQASQPSSKNYLEDDLYKKALGKRATGGSGSSASNDSFGLNSFMSRYNSQQQESQTQATESAPAAPAASVPDEAENMEDQQAATGGIAGMRALFRRRTPWQQNSRTGSASSNTNEVESAMAASAVARFLIGGAEGAGELNESDRQAPPPSSIEASSSPSYPRGKALMESISGGEKGIPPSNPLKRQLPEQQAATDDNVALVKTKKRRKVEMTQDLRLGTLVIPLTRLPLAKATCGDEAARIESWYQLDLTTNALSPVETSRSRALSTATKLSTPRRSNPSILLEISFSAPKVLDESEDELEVESVGSEGGAEEESQSQGGWNNDESGGARGPDNRSFSRRTVSNEIRQSQKGGKVSSSAKDEEKKKPEEKKRLEDPVLEPGVCDFLAVVGASNIGDQQGDDGSKGWVSSNPECTILEQFPPSDEFHAKHGRNVTLQMKAEWFCFPEGCRLWRGAEPPTHTDLNLKRFSASSPPNVASSIAAFDACMNCTTSFSWFVIQSNEKENDFKNLKTYGAVIKFYAPAPPGIDRTQDDYAQNLLGGGDRQNHRKQSQTSAKRLWVPLGILMTTNLPIIGTLEAMLLRLCEALAQRVGRNIQSTSQRRLQQIITQDLANLVVNFQKPIPGVLHCSVPFLTGDRLHLTVPPPTGLPPLPHGGSVTSVCKLLGSDGLNDLLAAVLTECKVLIHSDEISNLPMVAEVVTALIYPFVWSLPYLPVLPDAMMEFVEAPLSYFIGIPSCNMKHIHDDVLADIVVIDLDNTYTSPDYYDGRRGGRQTKAPTALPASVASNISKAVFRLLREEEEVEEEYGQQNNFPGSRSLPRLEDESQAEREFRIAVALQICGLVRGYDDCLFKVSASQPVFNREKFLRTAPALFEDRRGNMANSSGGSSQQRMLSPRSKRFLSQLVGCQHFHQFLESLEHDECAFFNEVMYTFDMHDDRDDHPPNQLMGYGSSRLEEAASHLSKALQKVEDKIPTYRVDRKGKKKRRTGGMDDDDDEEGGFDGMIDVSSDNDIGFSDDGNLISSFTSELLKQVKLEERKEALAGSEDDDAVSVGSLHSGDPRAIDVDMLQQLDKTPWQYNKLFEIPLNSKEGQRSIVEVREKVKLRDAIGERRYRAWKVAQEQKLVAHDTSGRMFTADLTSTDTNNALDLTSLLSNVTDETATDTSSMTGSMSSNQSRRMSNLSPEQQRVADAKDRDVLRRCLERAYEGGTQRRPVRFGRRPSLNHTPPPASSDGFFENGRDLIADAEAALRNPSAQKFLVSVLSQRSRLENQRKRRHGNDDAKGRRQAKQSSVSRLEPPAFDCLVRLCCAMLDACMETKNYESGYNLLIHTQGFCTVQSKDGKPISKQEGDYGQELGTKVVYMTARISLHPIYAELELWEIVLQLHLNERESDKNVDQSGEQKGNSKANADIAAYETTVSTLWEMHGYGIPAEELARFATRVSEQRGWFSTERGHSLLMLARRLSVKRENGDDGTGNAGDLEMMRSGKGQASAVAPGDNNSEMNGVVEEDTSKFEWAEIGWCHPATTSGRPSGQLSHGDERGVRTSHNLLNMIGDGAQLETTKIDDSKHLKRSAVTSLAAFGSSIIASGGLDGSVFVAHTISFATRDKENTVKGVRLDWGSSGGRSTNKDGEYGVGAVSCLAAAKGAGYRGSALSPAVTGKDVTDTPDEDEMLQAMEGCRVVAGTTGGDLRVWSVRDVYAATVLAQGNDGSDAPKAGSEMRTSHGGAEGPSSSYPRSRRQGSITEIAAGSAKVRLKYSLRGRQLSGHRGGVSCIDVPSHIYRPDSLVTGGADGFIKLWSLRAPTGRRSTTDIGVGGTAPLFNATSLSNTSGAEPLSSSRGSRGLRGTDALSILSGHTGRVLCVKTAWHGDRLLSGGADCTVKMWDLASSGGGRCLHSLAGHLGWVTHAHYWGPNTIVSASTDRAIALWDTRVRRSPLFVLRYHQSPVSDLLVGSRTDPLMVSAAGDGTVATWDFRSLSGTSDANAKTTPAVTKETESGKTEKKCKAIRAPSSTILHARKGKGMKQAGAVLLSRGSGKQKRTVITVGADAVTREWEISTGRMLREDLTGHCDIVSSMHAFSDGTMGASSGVEPDAGLNFGGTVTCSWDGTIRMKKLIRR